MIVAPRVVAEAGRIGKFEVLARIGRGGMADVYRCRLRGIGGFEKVVVVKRIRAERASDPDFVTMFLDEARLAANLSHPNIVQVYEIGEIDTGPYIAMEYVPGPTLARLLRDARRARDVRIGHLTKIIAGVCEALHHAHSATSATGEPLGLVHRDVSPQNIVISHEGVPKLLDFGVAKANGRLTATGVGAVKGKLRYVSPEQIDGMVDHRADVFAVGVCLFEATTGSNPYAPRRVDETTLLRNLTAGKYARPSELVRDYPRALEEVVCWAIAPDPERRCPSALDLHDHLEALLAGGQLASSTRAVAAWVNRVVTPERDEPASAPDQVETVRARVEPPASGRPVPWRRSAGVVAAASAGVVIALLSPRHASPAAQPALRVAIERTSAGPLASELPDAPLPDVKRAPPPRHKVIVTEEVAVREPALEEPDEDDFVLAAPEDSDDLQPFDSPSTAPPNRADDTPRPAAVAGIYSASPRSPVPLPKLPRIYDPEGADDLDHVLSMVEQEAVGAGCSPEFAHGITAALASGGEAAEVYPVAIYYFIVREAALGREKHVASRELGSAYQSGLVRALNVLPADDRSPL